jgi:N6-adenosine-specific RNA methylase IME4
VRTGAKAKDGQMASGAAQKYGVLTMDQINRLPVEQLVGDGPAVLFLWATVPLADAPFETMRQWGFDYKTTLFWRKTGRLGMGHWLRGQVEPLHIAIRGKVPPFKSSRRNVVEAPTEGHSVKPDIFHSIVEELVPVAERRVELFARRPRDGWETYGLELGQDFTDQVAWNAICRPGSAI